MNAVEHDLDQVRERAALYALGALESDEATVFSAHLASGCSLCSTEVAAFARVVDTLGNAEPPQAAAPSMRARVFERIAADQPATIDKEGILFAYSDRLPWTPIGVPGLEIKVLARDEGRGMSTQLVRMAPGAKFPAHRHAATEELYLLEGDLLVSGVLMHAGDFCRADTGSQHSSISTRNGCVFISSSSEHDELIV